MKRAPNPASDGIGIQIAASNDRAEWNRQSGIAFPPAAQVSQHIKTIRCVSKTGFVNYQSSVDMSIAYGRHDLIERHDDDFANPSRYMLRCP
ncbi:hypothetical protein D3C76_1573010 [compost metagenome]